MRLRFWSPWVTCEGSQGCTQYGRQIGNSFPILLRDRTLLRERLKRALGQNASIGYHLQ